MKKTPEACIWRFDNDVEGEHFEHVLFEREEVVAPFPVFFAAFVDEEFGILLGDFCDGDDDFVGLAAVFFGFGREEEGGCCYVLRKVLVYAT